MKYVLFKLDIKVDAAFFLGQRARQERIGRIVGPSRIH